MRPKSVAFIPARSGSNRVPNKNIKLLGGHPMLAYTVRAAIDSSAFDAVICATDSQLYADVARHYGAEVPFLRSSEISGDKSPDIEWVVWMLNTLKEQGRDYESFSILRPTSPFRLPETIRRACDAFTSDPGADSLRAIEKCKQHPGKMWTVSRNRMHPLIPMSYRGTPWHSCQTQSLPAVYAQNASLEIAWVDTVWRTKSIAGHAVMPYFMPKNEGFDINTKRDWAMALLMVRAGVPLPEVV